MTVLGGAASAWPLATWAQQPDRVRLIGIVEALMENDSEGQARKPTQKSRREGPYDGARRHLPRHACCTARRK